MICVSFAALDVVGREGRELQETVRNRETEKEKKSKDELFYSECKMNQCIA